MSEANNTAGQEDVETTTSSNRFELAANGDSEDLIQPEDSRSQVGSCVSTLLSSAAKKRQAKVAALLAKKQSQQHLAEAAKAEA